MRKDWLRRCDFLNMPASLSYKNEYLYSTNVGAILTIFLFFVFMFITLYEIILLCQKSSFTLISNQYTDLSQKIDFSQTPFLFELTNDYGQLVNDNKLISIEAYDTEMSIINENGISKKKFTNTKLELENCDKILTNKSEYSGLDLSRYICVKPGQNLTGFGLVGDINYPFKGIRIYINKCKGPDCYNTSEIIKRINNCKFIVTYLSLSSNMFYLNNEKIKYQLYSKYFSLSTNVLKKIIFTYDIGKFYLYNDIALGNEISLNYILGNDYTIDFDLDPTSTIQNNEYTIASISFNYGGRIIETRKKVQTIFETLTTIGNLFNIFLTIFKVINNYYANKILFFDIFRTLFLEKNNVNFNNKNNIHININANKNCNKSINLDLSNEVYANDNINKNISIKSKTINKNLITIARKNSKLEKPKIYNKLQRNFTKTKLIYYYVFPLWVIKRFKALKNICLIKDIICGYFSIEKFNELIKFKELVEAESKKSKLYNTELIKVNNNSFGKMDLIEVKNI